VAYTGWLFLPRLGTRNVSLINIERVAAALSLSLADLFRLVERS
jgi:hypothetical protein